MKRNQPHSSSRPSASIRLVDVGPKIEFLPHIKHIDWAKVHKQLPTAGITALTVVLVAHLTIGSGAAMVAATPVTQTPDQAATPMTIFEAIDNSLSVEQLGAESLLISRSRAVAQELAVPALMTVTDEEQSGETPPAETASTTVSAPTEAAPAEPAATEPAPTQVPTPEPAPAQKASAPVAVDTQSALTAEQQQQIVDFSRSLLGVPYVYAGTTASGLDCSGFTLYVYRELFGLTLPHKSSDQVNIGTGVDRSQARIGDILCFDWDYNEVCDHVAIYIGNSHYVNASQSRGKVTEQVADFAKDPIIAVRRLIN